MPFRKRFPGLALIVFVCAGSLPAQSETPAAAAPGAARETAASPLKADLEALIRRVQTRLEAGVTTPAGLAEELATFDALAAKYAADKTDEAAMIGVMKAMLYVQVFQDPGTAIPLLKRSIADFPGTRVAAELPGLIAQLEETVAAEAATAIGKEFAPFKETATDGTVIDLAAYRGKVVLVDFWATWCGPCSQELPYVKAAYDAHHATGFEIIGVSLDKDGEKLAAFTKEKAMPWPQLFDGQGWQSKLARAYGVRAIPATFLLDREGKIAAKGLRGEALSAKVAELLATKP